MMYRQKHLLMVAACAGVIALAGLAAANPPVQWQIGDGGNGHWYQAILDSGSWPDANAAAEAAGGYLATITSSAENTFVYGLVDDDSNFWSGTGSWRYGPWLGGFQPPNSPDPAGNWYWVTAEAWSYTNWYADQPNDGDSPGQDSLHFMGSGAPGSGWNDALGDSGGAGMRGYIIEGIVPEPVTLSLLALGGLALLRRKRGFIPRRLAREGCDGALGKTEEERGAAMATKCVLGGVISTIVVVVISQAAFGAGYDLGYVWHRESDWTVRPGADHRTTNGNPDDDSNGTPVWSYEFYANIPGDSNLDSANPWFTLPWTGLMVWDSDWSGGVWARWDDSAPATRAERMLHVNAGGSQALYDEVPLVRWINPCDERIRVSLTSGPAFGVAWYETWGVLDAVIAMVDASEANAISVLYSIAVTKPTNNAVPETLLLPSLDLDEFYLDPGDEILFSIRSRTTHAADTWKWVYFQDDVAITIVPEPEPPSGIGATVFLSPVTEVGGGAVEANPELTVQIGETVRLGLWVSAAEGLDVNQIALDLVETAGILDANGLTILEAGALFRWDTVVDANLNVSALELYIGSIATGDELNDTSGLSGNAIVRGIDPNFDPAAADGNGAFLYAIIEFTATALGDTDLYLRVGGETISYDPNTDTAIHFGIGDDAIWRTMVGARSSLPDATIHVVPVPEPATLLVMTAAGLPVLLRHRRSGRSSRSYRESGGGKVMP